MNTVLYNSNNVNCTPWKTASEAACVINRFNALVNLSKFALASEPERRRAIQEIKYALERCSATDAERIVLNKVIEILEVKP